MTDDLISSLEDVRRRISRYRSKDINEQNTKASMIQPVLRALGWDVEDLDDVQREYRHTRRDKPVDYALFLLRNPCLFVEAKALGKNLDDRRWTNQIMGYAVVAGVKWVVLTDGDEYRIYNSHESVPVEEKLFRTVKISESVEEAADTLVLLTKGRISESAIDILWKAHFVDRQVQTALETLFSTETDADPALVRLVKKRVENLSTKDVRSSLQRADIQISYRVDITGEINLPSKPQSGRERKTKSNEQQLTNRNSQSRKIPMKKMMAEIIIAGILSPPITLRRKYKGHNLTAKVLKNGTISFEGKKFQSPSSAAAEARKKVIGRDNSCNGWSFWRYRNDSGELVKLDEARQELLQEDKGK